MARNGSKLETTLVRKLILGISVLPLLALTFGCAPAPVEEIKIGCIVPLTGPLVTIGNESVNGAMLAVNEINTEGGIAGKKVVLLVEDDAAHPATTLLAIKKLIELDGVEVIIGSMTSDSIMASGGYAAEMRILLVSPSVSSSVISQQPWTDFVFLIRSTDSLGGKALGQLILEKRFKRIAILAMDNPYGIGIEMAAREVLAGKADIVASIRYDPTRLDYHAELESIKEKAPDLVLHIGYQLDGMVLYKQALNAGLDAIQWIAGEGSYDTVMFGEPDVAEFMQKAVIGIKLTAPGGHLLDEFRTAYTNEFGAEPGAFSDFAYDATKLVALAIEKAGVYDGAEIRNALWQVGRDYRGLTGTITFDEKGDRISGTYEVWKVDRVAGQYRFVPIMPVSF